MFNFIKRIFGGKKKEVKMNNTIPNFKHVPPPPPVPPKYDKSYQTRRQPTRTTQSDSDDGFLTSMIVAEVTDSTLLGAAVGGNVLGAIIGDSLNDSDSHDSSGFDGFGGGDFSGGGSGGYWDDSSSSSDDYSSSSDSSFDSSSNDW